MESRETSLEIFESKKNYVEKLSRRNKRGAEEYVVRKKYENTAAWEKEKRYLPILKDGNCAVPQILQKEKDLIIMEYIDGEVMVDLALERCSTIVESLLETLQEIYTVLRKWDPKHQWILGDMNLRNFIYHKKENKVYRIDLEDLRKGDITEDLGEFLAFYITYHPAFTKNKQEMARKILSEFTVTFDMEEEKLKKEANLALKKLKKRRGLKKIFYF